MLSSDKTKIRPRNEYSQKKNTVPSFPETQTKTSKRRQSFTYSTKLNLQELIEAGGHGSSYRNYASTSKDDNIIKQRNLTRSQIHYDNKTSSKPKPTKLRQSILLARESKKASKESLPGEPDSVIVSPQIANQEIEHSRNFQTLVYMSLCNRLRN